MQPSPKKPLNHAQLINLLKAGTPIIDVRAPLEFKQGCLPEATNLPILDDVERAKVGTRYKSKGSEAATTLGFQLVSGERKQDRLEQWLDFASSHAECQVMCWRGGQRSQIAQAWLAERGVDLPRIEGGYKAFRHTCLHVLEEAAANEQMPWWVVAGRTGSQKTVLINAVSGSIDLEHLAHHRGSAFGAHSTPQPSPATFENCLAQASLRHTQTALVLEDESRTIGRVALPASWHARMQLTPLVLIEAEREERIEHIVAEYVDLALQQGFTPQSLQDHYQNALKRISRRLGGALHQRISELLSQAFAGQTSHQSWVETLLRDYYDPMYDYQLKTKQSRIVFRGKQDEVLAFLTAKSSTDRAAV